MNKNDNVDPLNKISISFKLEQVSLRQYKKSCKHEISIKTIRKETIIMIVFFDRKKVKGIWIESHQQLHSQKYKRGAQRYQITFFCKTLLLNVISTVILSLILIAHSFPHKFVSVPSIHFLKNTLNLRG